MQAIKNTIFTFATAALLAVPATAQDQTKEVASDHAEVKTATDREWVTISGTVKESAGEYFSLNYGKGSIIVEMDDYDPYNDNLLLEGDKVSVTGKIDKDFYESKSLEASSVYSERLNTYFYANPADEETSLFTYPTAALATNNDWVGMTGIVQSVDDSEVRMMSGQQAITIDLTELPKKPSVEKGDRISVYGKVDNDLFEGFELVAASVTTMSQG